jgi:multidrug efflux system outer membrane protein
MNNFCTKAKENPSSIALARKWGGCLCPLPPRGGEGKANPSVIAAFCLFTFLAGCAVGPNYDRPAALKSQPLPNTFGQSLAPNGAITNLVTATNLGDWKPAQPSAHLPHDHWWELFNDPELNRLQTLAASENQELAANLSRFEQARALVNVARADFFPNISANPSVGRQRTSFNSFDSGHAAGVSHTYNSFVFPLEASWEVDLWGRVRRQVQAARERLSATADDMESAKLAIQAEVATDYFTLRALDSEYVLLQRAVETFTRSLDLTRNRRKGGIASDLDVSQAETQLKATEAQLPAVGLQRSKLLHALAVLCGQPAMIFQIATATQPELNSAPAVPISFPSELLERRPDIASAERHMAAANEEIGVAKAAFYPRVVFHGLAGFQSISASTLFDWPSRVWAVGPSLDLPLFTGGRNRAQLALTRAAYQENISSYRQTVLTAFQDVEDQLAAQRLLETQIEAEAAALAAARRTLEIANNRYKAGLVTYLEVAAAQDAELNRERTLVQLQGERLVAGVGLIRSLGGGWQQPAAETRAGSQ